MSILFSGEFFPLHVKKSPKKSSILSRIVHLSIKPRVVGYFKTIKYLLIKCLIRSKQLLLSVSVTWYNFSHHRINNNVF